VLVWASNRNRKSREKLGRADAFVVSIPKSGRTWLRFFLRHYLCRLAGAEFHLSRREDDPPWLPWVSFTHDLWLHATAPRLRQRLDGRYLIPRAQRRSARIVLAVRDPRDVVVSLHFQLAKRGFKSGARFSGSLSQMIRDRRLGVDKMVAIMNHWLGEWRDTGRLAIWSYEQCQKDPETAFAEVVRFLVPGAVDADALAESIEFASFDNMRAMERAGLVERPLLRPGDPEDPDSYKVRRGVVGGYRDYLDADDLRLVERAAARLKL
jgi:hypothetical protein